MYLKTHLSILDTRNNRYRLDSGDLLECPHECHFRCHSTLFSTPDDQKIENAYQTKMANCRYLLVGGVVCCPWPSDNILAAKISW